MKRRRRVFEKTQKLEKVGALEGIQKALGSFNKKKEKYIYIPVYILYLPEARYLHTRSEKKGRRGEGDEEEEPQTSRAHC